MPKEESIPESEVIDSAINNILVPTIKQIEKDAKELLPTKVYVMKNDIIYLHRSINSDADSSKGEVRIRFRETSSGKRVLFFAEAIYNEIAKETGFSGFQIKGEVRREGFVAERTAFTVQYNVWDWKGWL